MTRALVVGGSGAVGSLFREILAGEWDVTVVDVRAPGSGWEGAWIEGGATDPQVLGAAGDHDVIVLAVPEDVAIHFVEGAGGGLRADQLLVDTLSVKTDYLAAVAAHVERAGVLSLNPMFAPDLGLDGRSVATIRVRDNARSDPFLDLLTDRGGVLVSVEPDAHDRLTAALQVAGHAAVVAFGRTLARLGYDAGSAAALWTPPHRMLLALLARMGDLDPEVYRDIQTSNPAAAGTRRHLASAILEIEDVCGDPDRFRRYLDEALTPLGDRRDELSELASRLFRVD